MSYEEVVEMMVDLVQMSEENFQKCIEYVANADLKQNVRKFLQLALKIADEKRQSVIA